jgi:arylformamidase
MSEWRDVTRRIRPGMPVWPGDPPVQMEQALGISRGDAANVTRWHLGAHTGTHVDAPLHFIAGAGSVGSMSLQDLCGEALVVDLSHVKGHISARDLDSVIPSGTRRILLRTANSDAEPDAFHEDFVALTPDAATWAVVRGIRAIGVDGPSIEAFRTTDYAVHRTILGARIAVIEGLDLAGVDPGRYEMVCAPLYLAEAEGAPARVFLRGLDSSAG